MRRRLADQAWKTHRAPARPPRQRSNFHADRSPQLRCRGDVHAHERGPIRAHVREREQLLDIAHIDNLGNGRGRHPVRD